MFFSINKKDVRKTTYWGFSSLVFPLLTICGEYFFNKHLAQSALAQIPRRSVERESLCSLSRNGCGGYNVYRGEALISAVCFENQRFIRMYLYFIFASEREHGVLLQKSQIPRKFRAH